MKGDVDLLRRARIFQGLSDDCLARIAERVQERHFSPRTPLMRQGDPSEVLYIVAEGRVRVERADQPGQEPAILAELGAGDVVGEMGVLDRKPRSATVMAVSAVDALELSAAELTEIMVHQPEVREALQSVVSQRLRDTDGLVARMFADILERVAIFKPVSPEALVHLAEKGDRRFFEPGQALMRQGEPSRCMYVIAEGEVRIERSHSDLKEPMVLARLGAGEVVGEMGVLDGAPRSATVVAETQVETMELDTTALSEAMLRYPEIAGALLHVVTKRMRSTDALLEDLVRPHDGPSSNGTSNRAPPEQAAAAGLPRAGPGPSGMT